jgi:hypothetical protein
MSFDEHIYSFRELYGMIRSTASNSGVVELAEILSVLLVVEAGLGSVPSRFSDAYAESYLKGLSKILRFCSHKLQGEKD